MSKRKQHHIVINEETDTLQRIEAYKRKLNLKSNQEVIDHFIPKTDVDFFEYEWELFKKTILKYIPEDSKRRDFLQTIEALYFIVIVNGNKISPKIIEHMKLEYGMEWDE